MEATDIQSEALATLNAAEAPLTARRVFDRSVLAEKPSQVANALHRLKSAGCVEQAQGDLRGYMLTDAGRARLGGDTPAADKKADTPRIQRDRIRDRRDQAEDNNPLGKAPEKLLGTAPAQPTSPVHDEVAAPVTQAAMDWAVTQMDAEIAAERAAQPRFGFFSDGALEIATEDATVRLGPAETRRLLDWMVSIKPAVHRPLGYADVKRVAS